MRNSQIVSLVCLVALLVTFLTIGSSWRASAEDERKQATSLQEFMRKKLDASSLILEGLTVEDSDLIQRGAQALLHMSVAERWQVIVDMDYREHSANFRSNVKKLSAAAEKGNFDNAALQWFDTVKSCIECHHDLRLERTLGK